MGPLLPHLKEAFFPCLWRPLHKGRCCGIREQNGCRDHEVVRFSCPPYSHRNTATYSTHPVYRKPWGWMAWTQHFCRPKMVVHWQRHLVQFRRKIFFSAFPVARTNLPWVILQIYKGICFWDMGCLVKLVNLIDTSPWSAFFQSEVHALGRSNFMQAGETMMTNEPVGVM